VNEVTQTPSSPRLGITVDALEWLAAIAEASPNEVQALLLGSPDENRVDAGFITLGQENTAASVHVSPAAFADSVAAAKQAFARPVLGMAHLHPGGMGAFASTVDEKNLLSLGELLSKPLLRPVTRTSSLLLAETGEWELDPYGRKVLTAGVGVPDEASPGCRTESCSLPVQYVETRMRATVYSVTFARKSPPSDATRATFPGRGKGAEVALFAQALELTYCCDPDCATPKRILANGVPVQVVAAGGGFAWTWEEVERQLRERVKPMVWGYGGHGYGYQWNAADAPLQVAAPAEGRGPDEPDFPDSAPAPERDPAEGDGSRDFAARAAGHRPQYRYLRGTEGAQELPALVERFKDEIRRRIAELAVSGDA
jgi:hypothetical protein